MLKQLLSWFVLPELLVWNWGDLYWPKVCPRNILVFVEGQYGN